METHPTLPLDLHPREAGGGSPIATTPRRLRRRSMSPPASLILSDRKESTDSGLDVSKLPTDKYEVVISKVETQINNIITQAIFLQNREILIDKLIFYESIVYLISSSMSNTIGASKIDSNIRMVIMYIFLGLNIIFSCFGLYIKWLKSRHMKDINSYRDVLKELVMSYGQDAWLAIENSRMGLPPEVLAQGFFHGINKN